MAYKKFNKQTPGGCSASPRPPPGLKNKLGREIFWKFNWGAEFFENSILHEFLIQGAVHKGFSYIFI